MTFPLSPTINFRLVPCFPKARLLCSAETALTNWPTITVCAPRISAVVRCKPGRVVLRDVLKVSSAAR